MYSKPDHKLRCGISLKLKRLVADFIVASRGRSTKRKNPLGQNPLVHFVESLGSAIYRKSVVDIILISVMSFFGSGDKARREP